MSEAGSARSASQGDQQRFALMLRTWEAVSAERELHGVIAALADVLVSVVPFDSIAIIDFSKGLQAHDQHRIVALHVVGFPHGGRNAHRACQENRTILESAEGGAPTHSLPQ